MIKVKKYKPSVNKTGKNKLINLLASFILIVGLFLMLAQPIYAEKTGSVCKAGNGATCWCAGPCGANATSCWCK